VIAAWGTVLATLIAAVPGYMAYSNSHDKPNAEYGGTLLIKATRQPISGATLRLVGIACETKTDSAGHFSFESCPESVKTSKVDICIRLPGDNKGCSEVVQWEPSSGIPDIEISAICESPPSTSNTEPNTKSPAHDAGFAQVSFGCPKEIEEAYKIFNNSNMTSVEQSTEFSKRFSKTKTNVRGPVEDTIGGDGYLIISMYCETASNRISIAIDPDGRHYKMAKALRKGDVISVKGFLNRNTDSSSVNISAIDIAQD
jgi:hypothetical protein